MSAPLQPRQFFHGTVSDVPVGTVLGGPAASNSLGAGKDRVYAARTPQVAGDWGMSKSTFSKECRGGPGSVCGQRRSSKSHFHPEMDPAKRAPVHVYEVEMGKPMKASKDNVFAPTATVKRKLSPEEWKR